MNPQHKLNRLASRAKRLAIKLNFQPTQQRQDRFDVLCKTLSMAGMFPFTHVVKQESTPPLESTATVV